MGHEARGTMRLYSEAMLLIAAEEKFGRDGLEKKRLAREKRLSKKRNLEQDQVDDSQENGIAKRRLALGTRNMQSKLPGLSGAVIDAFQIGDCLECGVSVNDVTTSLSAEGISEQQIRATIEFLCGEGYLYSTVDENHYKTTLCKENSLTEEQITVTNEEQEQQRILGLQQITRTMRPLMTWDLLRQHQSRHGLWRTNRISDVSKAMFAAIIGTPLDVELHGLAEKKRGAWYSVYMPPANLYRGTAGVPRGAGGMYGGNSELSISPCDDVELKYCPGSQTLSVGGHIGPVPEGYPGYC